MGGSASAVKDSRQPVPQGKMLFPKAKVPVVTIAVAITTTANGTAAASGLESVIIVSAAAEVECYS